MTISENKCEAGEGVSSVFGQNLTTVDRRRKPDPKQMVTVDDLPLYAEDSKGRQFLFIPEDPLPLQREFTTIRTAGTVEYGRLVERFSFIDRAVNKTTSTATKVQNYVDDEWSVLPKAGAITIGGMAGFVLGLKRGTIGRAMGSVAGLAMMTAFCYPDETVGVVRCGSCHAVKYWKRFQQTPPISVEKDMKSSVSLPNN